KAHHGSSLRAWRPAARRCGRDADEDDLSIVKGSVHLHVAVAVKVHDHDHDHDHVYLQLGTAPSAENRSRRRTRRFAATPYSVTPSPGARGPRPIRLRSA